MKKKPFKPSRKTKYGKMSEYKGPRFSPVKVYKINEEK